MEKKTEINFRSSPVPTGPGAQQITNMDLQYQKGGAAFVGTMPEKKVPDGASGESFASSSPGKKGKC